MKPDGKALDGMVEEMLREDYERCHPDDTFAALKHRAPFSKEDRRLLEDWRAAIRARLAAGPPA